MKTEEFYDQIISRLEAKYQPIADKVLGPKSDSYTKHDPIIRTFDSLREQLWYYRDKRREAIKREQEEAFRNKLSKAADLIIKHYGGN